MPNNLLRKPRSMDNLLPPNYASDEGQFDLNFPRIRPAWLMNESIKSLDSKFPMVPAPTGSIVFYTTPLGEKLCQQPKNREFDLTDPLRPSLCYNYLHDEHLQTYLRSNDMRKRLLDEGFITDDGYVKCSLKEFNEYRQWIRKLKLDELNRERRQDEKKIEQARKERVERIALERDAELLEILKRRREKKREEAKLHEQRIKRERERQRKLDEMDRQRREKFVEVRRKTRDRIQIKRDLERERLRMKKCDDERQEHKIKLRIVRKMNKDDESRMKHLEEKKKEAKELKVKKLEEQWLRRESWSVEHHEHLKETKQHQTQQFQQHVEERNMKIAKQRRWSQVCYNEIAAANRRVFENQLEKAEVFLAKLNDKKAEELKKWRRKFDAMQNASHSTLNSKHFLTKNSKQRTRRQSAWDLESCLLKDLGMAEKDIKDNLYTKLGVISRSNEPGSVEDTVGHLGSLSEEGNEEETYNTEFRFSIPTIVESLASLQAPSSESDSDSEYSFHIPSVFRFESLHDLQPVSDSPEIRPNGDIPEEKLRTLVKDYVQDILHRSADVLGVKIKSRERTPREQIPKITDVKRIPKLKAKELDAVDANTRMKVMEYLSGVLDKVEDKMQIIIKRPPEYEQIKQGNNQASQSACETSVEKVIDNKLHYHSKRNVVRLYVCKIVENAAEQCQVNVKFPPQYQSFVKRLHRPRRKKIPLDNQSSKTAGQHSSVLKAISSGTVALRSPKKQKTMIITSEVIAKELNQVAYAIDGMKSKYDRDRAERLFHENLVMMSTRIVIKALHEAVVLVRAQRRNSDFFMADMPDLYLKNTSGTSPKEEAVLLKRQRSKHRRESLKTDNVEQVPREVDFLLEEISKTKRSGPKGKKGGKHISFQSAPQVGKQHEKKPAKTDNSRKQTGSENKPSVKTRKGAAGKKDDAKDKASGKVGEKPGKKRQDVEQEVAGSGVTISLKISIENGTCLQEIVEEEPRIKEIENENEGDGKQENEVTEDDKPQDTEGHDIGDNVGDDGIEAVMSTSLKSPSLPQVTPQASGFGLPSESVRSGAVPPYTETACETNELAAGSPSSAIFRMISMRETRESSELSPQASYVVLPTLTSSEGALINTRMEQMFNNDEAKSKGLESTPSLPALSRSPSNETHSHTNVVTDHANEPVKLPNVTSLESCPSRSPTPLRSSSSQSSQVPLPQIDGSNTSLVGGNEPTSGTETKPESKTDDAPQGTGVKTPPIVTTSPKTTAAKPPSPPKNSPGKKLQQGPPPARTKSEISRKTIATPALTPRKDGQVRSTTVIATQKGTTPNPPTQKGTTPNPPTQPKKPVELRKPLHTTTVHDRLAKSKSTGEATAARRSSLGRSQTTRRPSEATVRATNTAETAKSTTSTKSGTKATSPKTDRNPQPQKSKSDVDQKSDSSKVPVENSSKLTSRKSLQNTKPTPDILAKSTQDTHEKPTQDTHEKPTQDTHEKPTQDTHEKPTQDTHEKPTQDTHEKPTKDTHEKPTQDTHEKPTQDTHEKPTQDTHEKPTQDSHEKATQDTQEKPTNDAKTTQNGNSKTTSGGASKHITKGKGNVKKSAEKSKLNNKEKKNEQQTEKERVTEPETTSTSLPEEPTPSTEVTETTTETTSKPLPDQKDVVASSLESISPTKFSPELTPEGSSTPKAISSISEDEFTEKPQAMVGAIVTSPDLQELTRINSPKERRRANSITCKILNTTESDTDFYLREHDHRKLEHSNDDLLDDEVLEDYNTGKKRRYVSGIKPTTPKGKRMIRKSDSHDDEDETKADDVKARVNDDGATKGSDNNAKVSDDAKNGVLNETDNINSNTSKTSMRGVRKDSLNENMKIDNRSRSSSKTNSIQALSSQSKISKSRRGSRSVSFSSTSQQLPDAQKDKKESVDHDNLTKRRSSQKMAKKASNKDLKRRRSSLSSQQAKGKNKPNTDVTARIDSRRKASNSGLSKGKTHKKYPKDTDVGSKMKSKEKTPEDSQETDMENSNRIRDLKTSKDNSHVTRKDDKREIGPEKRTGTGVDDSQGTDMDKSKKTGLGVDRSQRKRVDGSQETRVDESQKTRVDESQKTRVDESQETRVDESQETRVDESQKTRVDKSEETRVDESQEKGVNNSQETGVDKTTESDESQKTRVDDSQKTRVDDSQETRGDNSQETREGRDDHLKKSESDVEVVVQVYVPDEGKIHGSDHVRKQTSSREKSAHGKTVVVRKEISAPPKEPPGVTKIDLQFGFESPDVKKTSSRRAFGDVNEKSLMNIVPRNSLDMIKGMKLNHSENKGFPSRSFHSKTNFPRAPAVPKGRGSRTNASESKALKVANFELRDTNQAGGKTTGHNKPQLSAHRLASKMSTNLEKVDEGSALETSSFPSEESTKLTTVLNISKAGVTTVPDIESSDNLQTENQENKDDNQDEKVDKDGETNEKTEPVSNKSLNLLMQASNVCINPASFAQVVQGTPLLSKEPSTDNDDVIGHTSSASIKSNASLPLVPSPPNAAKPDIVSPRISRMMSRKISNGSGRSRGSRGSSNEMSPTASMEIVKLASNSSHGWVSSPTSSVKFLPPIDARASKASNASDDSSKRRPRSAESAASRTGSVESKTSSGSRTKAAVVEVRRSGSGDLRVDGSSSALIGVKSSSSTGSRKQTVVGF